MDKKYKLMGEHEHLLDDIKQYCQIDAEVESKLSLKKARDAFRISKEKLIQLVESGNGSVDVSWVGSGIDSIRGPYDLKNEFVRKAFIHSMLTSKGPVALQGFAVSRAHRRATKVNTKVNL